MADSCPDTVDGEIIGISEGQQLNTTKNEDFDAARPHDKEVIQREGVTNDEQSSHLMKDDLITCKNPPTTTASLEDGVNATLSATSKSQDKTDESEIINSQSYTPSQSEVTPTFSMASLELSEETNGIPPEIPLISSKSAEDGNQVPSQGSGGACVGAARASEPSMPAYYFVKWITWKEKKTAIITQSENGPCPLIAIMNILLLRWKVKLPAQTEVVTTEELMAHLGECVLSIKPRERAEGMELNFQQNMSDAMAVLPKLSTGLDVNVRFTGVSDFEYTPECIVFDLLDIPLYHGWLVDPQSPEVVSAVGKLSYNQLVEKIIEFKHSTDTSQVSEDQGFLQEESVVWESLHNVEGDGNFCDSDFRLCHPSQKPTGASQPSAQQQQQMQIDQDYLVAMSLQQQQGDAPGPMSDLELARQLQQEEYQQPQTQQHQPSAGQMRGQAAPQQGGQRRREKKDDSDCCIL
ncbi:hypothetical protein cypCar_00011546 [Cyprinus carpio]|nr:hypothetical protein cypCar_00011546 [Cyprinus carpio]